MIDPVKHEVMADMRVYQASTRVFKAFLLVWHRLKIHGAKNIPDRGGVLIASNHASFLDPPVVGVGYRGRPIHFMARDTLWNSKFGSWWMDHVGCIPVSRGTGDMKALKLTIKALKEGKVVSMFPEGTRTEDGELQEAKGGIGFIIEKSGCNVVPAYIDGSFQAYPKGAKWIKPKKLTISYGKPITREDFQALGSGREAYGKYAALIMQRIADLKNKAD
ncbi:MAG: 1-acyl-sn-glycerol-3-phosphate acyltransferase [Pontiellaceae bacterium]|nr:1-acyl-sn-glycerol-3-phosphate acyltransferase [Pontiellaceae bacterium]MBN2783422.1 1-acyl-sn-glycerol-3-phosphate acyltransferase [Pontiellaceae bacterium]